MWETSGGWRNLELSLDHKTFNMRITIIYHSHVLWCLLPIYGMLGNGLLLLYPQIHAGHDTMKCHEDPAQVHFITDHHHLLTPPSLMLTQDGHG